MAKSSQHLVCDICNKSGFKNAAGLAGHKQIAHIAEGKVVSVQRSTEILEGIDTLRGAIQDLEKRFGTLESRESPSPDIDRMTRDLTDRIQELSSQIKLHRNTTNDLAKAVVDIGKKVEESIGGQAAEKSPQRPMPSGSIKQRKKTPLGYC